MGELMMYVHLDNPNDTYQIEGKIGNIALVGDSGDVVLGR